MSNQQWLHIVEYINYLSSTYFLSLLSFHWRSTRDEKWKMWCGYVWRGKRKENKSCLHILLRTVIWRMSHPLTAVNRPGFLWNMDTYVFGYLLRSDKYVSNQYILDRNLRLSSYIIGVMYLDYISLLLVCGDCPLTSKRGVCWNLIPDSLDQVESQMDSNAIYYFEFQTWNLALQPA